MTDNPYEKLVRLMQSNKGNKLPLSIGVMTSDSSVKVGNLELDKSDLLVSWTALHSQHVEASGATINVEDIPLKKGDIVLVARISDETYAIIERMVKL